MKKYLSMLLMAALPLLFSACGDDDYYDYGPGWGGGGGGQKELNRYEQRLVGSYVSDDDPDSPFYLVLNNDRTGSYKSVKDGQTTGSKFIWEAEALTLYVQYEGDRDVYTMKYYFKEDHLYVDDIPLIPNTGGDKPSAKPLVGQWQGTINDNYYYDVHGVPKGTYATICEFDADGAGAQLDYDVNQPLTNYAYNPFTWVRSSSGITLTYLVNSAMSVSRISDYALTSASFTGTLGYGTQRFSFAFVSVEGFDWTPYAFPETAAKNHLKALRQRENVPVARGTFRR